MFDDLFGGLFDFNGDGDTDFGEEMLGLAIMDDIIEGESEEVDPDDDLDLDEWD